MNNSSASDGGWSNLPVYIAFMGLGSVISIANGVILLAIIKYEALRNNKEYMLMLGVSLADTVKQIGCFVTGVYRFSLLVRDIHETTRTVSECLGMLHPLLLQFGAGLGSLMLFALSVDRLYCVLSPLSYIGCTVSYARRLVACVFIFKLFGTLEFLFSAWGGTAEIPAACAMAHIRSVSSGSKLYSKFASASAPLYALLSVLIYVAVIVIHKRPNNVVHPAEHPNKQYEMKRQRRVTMTLWTCAICTLLLFVLPYCIAVIFVAMGRLKIALMFVNLSTINHLASVVIYPLRHKEIRQALGGLWKCKRMPVDIRMWRSDDNPPQQGNNSKPAALVPRGPLANMDAGSHPNTHPNPVDVIELV